ncbi:MAG: PAS domain S-box protein [Acidimicrobiales bacterium]
MDQDTRDPADIGATTEQLLDSAPDGVMLITQSGTICLVNRQAERLFGYDRTELIGQPIEMLVPEDIRELHALHWSAYFANPTTRPMGAGLELSALRKDGTEFPADISLSSLETSHGVLVSAAIRDVTERGRIEEERSQLEARLQRAQRDEEQAQLEAQLHQARRLESVGQLAGGIAHDFNNLLAGIMNYSALVADGLREQMELRGLTENAAFRTLEHDVQEITTVAQRAAALTRQLLIFSHRELVKPEVLDLNSIVTDMEKLFRRTIGEDVDLRTTLGEDLPRTKVDRGQMEQVLMNVVVNARDAMPTGGTIEITTAAITVDDDYARVHSISPGNYVRLSVSDTGIGMSPEVASRAFEPFFTTKRTGAGHGLGLGTVYGIATKAGGAVAISSEPGLGTTIRVIFPATHEGLTPPSKAAQGRSLESKSETILLVEDEEMVREPTRRMLIRHGYAVLAAADADEALETAHRYGGSIDVLLTDVVMPRRSGKELAFELAKSRPTTRVLFMSGYSQDVIVHQGELEEGVKLIEKPFQAESLLRMLRDVLDGDPQEDPPDRA